MFYNLHYDDDFYVSFKFAQWNNELIDYLLTDTYTYTYINHSYKLLNAIEDHVRNVLIFGVNRLVIIDALKDIETHLQVIGNEIPTPILHALQMFIFRIDYAVYIITLKYYPGLLTLCKYNDTIMMAHDLDPNSVLSKIVSTMNFETPTSF